MSSKTNEMTVIAPAPQDFKAPVLPDNKLVLYFHPYNFYSQKVSGHNHVIFEKQINNRAKSLVIGLRKLC